MRFGALIALGLVFAAGLGLAGQLIARDTVALPAASIKAGDRLAPPQTPAAAPRRAATRTRTTAPAGTTTTTTATTTTTDDRSGRGRGRGRGEDDSSGSGSSGSGGSGSGRDHPEDD
jgi:hypothetical protein